MERVSKREGIGSCSGSYPNATHQEDMGVAVDPGPAEGPSIISEEDPYQLGPDLIEGGKGWMGLDSLGQ